MSTERLIRDSPRTHKTRQSLLSLHSQSTTSSGYTSSTMTEVGKDVKKSPALGRVASAVSTESDTMSDAHIMEIMQPERERLGVRTATRTMSTGSQGATGVRHIDLVSYPVTEVRRDTVDRMAMASQRTSTTSDGSEDSSAEEKYPGESLHTPVIRSNLTIGISAPPSPKGSSPRGSPHTSGFTTPLSKLKKDKKLRIGEKFKRRKKAEPLSGTTMEELLARLKENLRSMENEHAVAHMLEHVRTLSRDQKRHFYALLTADIEILHFTCDRLLEINELKQNEVITEWLFHLFSDTPAMTTSPETTGLSAAAATSAIASDSSGGAMADHRSANRSEGFLFATMTIPCLLWCLLTKDASLVSGIVAALLALYKTERKAMIAATTSVATASGGAVDGDALLSAAEIATQLFVGYRAPDLDLPSIFHWPKRGKSTAATPKKAKSGDSVAVTEEMDYGKVQESVVCDFGIVARYFPTLSRANLASNLYLMQVALEVFHHFCALLPHVVLEMYCAVASQLCAGGMVATDANTRLPESIQKALKWKWKWQSLSLSSESVSTKRHILPPNILNQFLTTVRFSLLTTVESTRKVARFALAQIHNRAHLDLIPAIILQTNAMFDETVFDFSS